MGAAGEKFHPQRWRSSRAHNSLKALTMRATRKKNTTGFFHRVD